MNRFTFEVTIGQNYCGRMSIETEEDQDFAYGRMLEIIGQRLYEALPDLDIEYCIDLVE